MSGRGAFGTKTGVFGSPCGPISVTRSDGFLWCEILDTAAANPDGYPDLILAREWAELRDRLAERAIMADLAERGKWLAERQADELDELGFAAAVDAVLQDVIPARAADRARAGLILDRLREAGHVVEFRHGAARCEPDPPPNLAGLFDELQPYLCDLLTEREGDGV